MKFRLVKHILGGQEQKEKISHTLYRDITLPFIPTPGLILQDGSFCEYIQATGYDLQRKVFEILVYPWFVEADSSAQELLAKAKKEGWTIDIGGGSMVDFEGKLTEEQNIRDFIDDVSECEEPAGGVDRDDVETWKEEHDKLFKENELDEEEPK